MKSFDIEITETLQRTVSVIADSREEAEQMVDDGWHNGDYVLDSEDFIDVDFKTVGEKEMSKDKKELDVLLVKPNEYPQKVTIGAELKDLQEAVGGTITATYPFTDPVAIVCNDEGKLLGLPMNRALRDEHGQTYDVLTGNFLVVGLGKEDFASLSPELAQKYEQHFHQPKLSSGWAGIWSSCPPQMKPSSRQKKSPVPSPRQSITVKIILLHRRW